MIYGSVCSGIEAATVAWHPLGWRPAWFGEIDPFCCRVLEHHYPDVPNLGDMAEIGNSVTPVTPIDVLVGGTPCQSFSVAGNRKGLDDDRGNLTLQFVRLWQGLRPGWAIWENVPGVLSDDTNAFGCLLAGLVGSSTPLVSWGEDGRWSRAGVAVGPGGSACWRVLDAQYLHLAQRRCRVYVVAGRAGGPCASAVLLEPESVPRHSPPGREAGTGVARSLTSSTGGVSGKEQQHTFVRGDGEPMNALPDVAWALQERDCKGPDSDTKEGHLIPEVSDPICSNEQRTYTHEGTNNFRLRNVIPFDTTQVTSNLNRSHPKAGDPCHPMATQAHPPAIASYDAVRRLTPTECERLQGFPDGYTDIPGARDGPRYRALGNTMPTTVMRWIGERIQQMEE